MWLLILIIILLIQHMALLEQGWCLLEIWAPNDPFMFLSEVIIIGSFAFMIWASKEDDDKKDKKK